MLQNYNHKESVEKCREHEVEQMFQLKNGSRLITFRYITKYKTLKLQGGNKYLKTVWKMKITSGFRVCPKN